MVLDFFEGEEQRTNLGARPPWGVHMACLRHWRNRAMWLMGDCS